MIKLKETILQLDDNSYLGFEKELKKNKAENFLYLIQSYRSGSGTDQEIIANLNISANSYYVLKSRLYTKIKNYISENVANTNNQFRDNSIESEPKNDLFERIRNITELCYNQPRDIATAFLEKLEKDLNKQFMHIELLQVYSAYKKIFAKSEKYFYYSKLYNKNIAFLISLEQCETYLSQINYLLSQFLFSRSQEYIDKILFLYKDICNHHQLCKSDQIETIKSLIEVELCLFCNDKLIPEIDLDEKLQVLQKLISSLPKSTTQNQWLPVSDFMYFMYYHKSGNKKALNFYIKLNSNAAFLLFSDIAPVALFLLEKLPYEKELNVLNNSSLIIDTNDAFSILLLDLYKSVVYFKNNELKKAINLLNNLLNTNSFKDYTHIHFEIKLTICVYYLLLNEIEVAESLSKSIYRKIKSENLTNYDNALSLIKFFNAVIEGKGKEEQDDLLLIFKAKNSGSKHQLLNHLINDLNLLTVKQ